MMFDIASEVGKNAGKDDGGVCKHLPKISRWNVSWIKDVAAAVIS